MSVEDEQEQAVHALYSPLASVRPMSVDVLQDARDHPYISMGKLAAWMVEHHADASEDILNGIVRAVELQLEMGTPDVRELIVVGLFEDLQNMSRSRGVSDDVWTPRLGRRTREMWRAIID